MFYFFAFVRLLMLLSIYMYSFLFYFIFWGVVLFFWLLFGRNIVFFLRSFFLLATTHQMKPLNCMFDLAIKNTRYNILDCYLSPHKEYCRA